MKIGLDISQTAFEGTGVARYTTALVKALLAHDADDMYTFLFTSLRKSPPKELVDAIKPPHILCQYPFPPTLTSFMWNVVHRTSIERYIGNVDVFISSDWTQPPTRSAKKVTIVHDLVPYLYPETSTTKTKLDIAKMNITPNIVETHKRRLAWVKKECDHIIADSKSTKNDLMKILKIPEKKITVIYPAIHTLKPTQAQLKHTLSEYKLEKPFILTVGTVQPRKNISRLIEAFIQAKLYQTMDLVIVGAQGWGSTQKPEIPAEAEKSIRFLGRVSEISLFSLYKQAQLFVMPSLYEGFGYPAIEAMAMGCPVATSNTSSLGELVTGYGMTFDPENVGSIQKALLKALAQSSKETIKKAQTYAQSFTHDRFAHDVLNVLRKLV